MTKAWFIAFFALVLFSCIQVASASVLEPMENVHNGRSPLWWHPETGCIFDKPEPYGSCIEEVTMGFNDLTIEEVIAKYQTSKFDLKKRRNQGLPPEYFEDEGVIYYNEGDLQGVLLLR